MNKNEATWKDSLTVYRVQSLYTKLLWDYLINQSNEFEACKYFTELLMNDLSNSISCK